MKKGFTLIELLTVIVVLGIIAGIAIPKIVDTIQSSRVKSCEEQVRTIENAAKRWGTENTFDLTIDKTNPNSFMIITVDKLQEWGYLSTGEIINSVTKESMKNPDKTLDKVYIKISYDKDNYQYSYKLYPENICNAE